MSSIILSLFISFSAFAGSGSATMPFWIKSADSDFYTNISITNIGSETDTVYVSLYDKDGNAYTESSEVGTNISIEHNFVGDPLSSNGATLAASKTGAVRITAVGPMVFGYMVIEWVSNGKNTKSLIGFVDQVKLQTGEQAMSNIMLINGGQPF